METLVPRNAIVTGAGAGIGRAVARRLALAGCDVGLFDVDSEGLRETADQVESLGRRALVVVGDVSIGTEVDAAVGRFTESLGPIDVLVNNAGILRTGRFLDLKYEDWRRSFAINVDGVFFFCRAVLPGMLERRCGSVVNMASWTGKKGVANHAGYAATKAAILNMTQSLAEEFGPFGVRVNAVCPGIIVDTNMRQAAEALNLAQGLPDVHTRAKAVPLRTVGYPQDVAEMVAFLSSEHARYVTGESVNVTGGLWMD